MDSPASAAACRRMKRIGILTFHRALNHGAVLQTYALQQTIAGLDPDIDVQIVDYRCPAIEWTREAGQAEHRQGLVRGTALRWLHHPFQKRRLQGFDTFLRDHLKLTPALTREALDGLDAEFDCLVCGSDQIWNPDITHGDSAFFLDFAPSLRRLAYAASFGMAALHDSSKAWFRRQLKHLAHVSVRESSAARIVEDLTGVRPPTVLDPTLLLTRQDWTALAQCPPSVQGRRYILIYNMVPTDHLIAFARDLSRTTGCQLRLIGHGLRHLGVPRVRAPTPAEFIGLFQNAEYVIANSFHGMAFAINFERPCFTETVDATGKVNARVQNLLEICGLQDRALVKGECQCELASGAHIDWTSVRKKLAAEREHSLSYLRMALGV